MLRSHSPSRVGANPLKSQPGRAANSQRPGQWGREDAGTSGRADPAAAPSQGPRAAAPELCGPAQEPESLRAQSLEPASERLSTLPAPTLPPTQPGGAAGDRARQRQARRRPAPRQVLRALRASSEAAEAGALLSAATPRTRRCPGRSFARLAYPVRGQFLRLSSPPAARLRGADTRVGDSQLGGPRSSLVPPRVRRPQQHLSPGPAPPGSVGQG